MLLITAVALFILCTLVEPVVITNYYQTGKFLTTDPFFTTYIGTVRSTWSVVPTATVTGSPISTSTIIVADGQITITAIDAILPSNAPATSTCDPWHTSCPSSSTSVTETSIFAPLVISQPSSCSKTSFAYTTAASVYIPSTIFGQILPQITEVSTSSYATSVNEAEIMAGTTEWYQVDVYLPTGIVVPEIPSSDLGWLHQCIDPRRCNCPMGEATALVCGCPITSAGYPPSGASGASGATGASASETSTGGAARMTGANAGLAVVAGGVAGRMLLWG